MWAFPIYKSTSFKLNLTPELPAAEMIRPQFGSQPCIAVFTKAELQIDFASIIASSVFFAP